MPEAKMAVSGNKFCCPKCKAELKVCYTLYGSEEDAEGIDDITIDEVMHRISFDGIEYSDFSDESQKTALASGDKNG